MDKIIFQSLHKILLDLLEGAPEPDLSDVYTSLPSAPDREDIDRLHPYYKACIENSPNLVAITQQKVNARWETERDYVIENRDNPKGPAVFYACRAIAQSIDADAEYLKYASPERANKALEVLIQAVDAISLFQQTYGIPADYEGCTAYQIQGLLWIAFDIMSWYPQRAFTLLQRISHLISTLEIPKNRLGFIIDSLAYLKILENNYL